MLCRQYEFCSAVRGLLILPIHLWNSNFGAEPGAAAFLFVCKRYFPDFSAFVSVVGLNWKAADVGNGLPVRVVELRV